MALLFTVPFAIAQKGTASDHGSYVSVTTGESIYIHANASTFITGETLYCKLYCVNATDKSASNISKIAYVELIDRDKKSVFKHKLNLENGAAQADFFIPTTLKTGNYKLIAYTLWMLNSAATNFFEMDLSIINPFQPLEKNVTLSTATKSNTTNPIPVSSDRVSVVTDKKVYGIREKVNLTIQSVSNQNKGNYSISVRKIDAIPVTDQSTTQSFKTSENRLSNDSKISILPEMRGEIVTGSIISKTGKSIIDKTIALSISGKSFAFKIAKTDRLGKFTFILDKSPTAATAVIQVMENDRNDYEIALETGNHPDVSNLKFSDTLALSFENKQNIEQRSVANQIENAYYERKKDSIDPEMNVPSFFHPLEKRYVLDDYTRFPTLRETITEVILEMYSVKKDNKYSIHLRNNTLDPEVYGLPLILIDGLLIQDTNELYDFNMENIYAVDLVNYPYLYASKTFSGVANFITKTNDYENKTTGDFIKTVAFARPLIGKKYYNPTYQQGHTNNRIPDYRQQIFWQPHVTLENEKSALTFYTSDLSGKFEIVLEGFTLSGIPVYVKEFFDVK